LLFTAFLTAGLMPLPAYAGGGSLVGRLDTGFSTSLDYTDGNAEVVTAVPQPDGKILLGGWFHTVGGESRSYLARLLPDGSVEPVSGFAASADSTVTCIAVQPDGQILAGGWFTAMNGVPAMRIARLNPDGTLESTATFNTGQGVDGIRPVVRTITVQPDGKILIGGEFSSVNGQPRNNLARLLPNGSLESTTTFDAGTGPASEVASIVVQNDGKILIAGVFRTVNGQTRNHIARLLPNGSLESTATFNPGTGASTHVLCLALQEDGKILVGGRFTQFNGQSRNRLARLTAAGALEGTSAFNIGTGFGGLAIGTSPAVHSIAVQTSGDILAGGDFTTVNGQARERLVRLSSNGALLTGTGTGLEGLVNTVSLQANGKMLIGGKFSSINGNSNHKNLARLHNFGVTQTLTAPSSTLVQWGRANGAPSVRGVTFDLSPDGEAWTFAGAGTRYSGGWQRAGLSLNGAGVIRARGLATAGQNNGSESLVTQIGYYNTAAPDAAFNPSVSDDSVLALAVQPDRKILLGGRFSTVGGQTNVRTARISPGGVPDGAAAYNTGIGPNGEVFCMAVQTDGKILAGGGFQVWNQQSRLAIVRLLPNGILESTATFNAVPNSVLGPFSLTLQPDGKILMAGGVTSLSPGQTQRGVVRLNANGSADSGFTGPQLDGYATSLALMEDGRMVIGGTFTTVNGQPRVNVARLLPGGALEGLAAFNPGNGPDDSIYCVVVQPDGKILLGGNFRSYNGQPRSYLARLLPNGALESTETFNPGTGPDSAIDSIVLQADGKIILGGYFATVDGKPFARIVRLLPDGRVESPASFNPGSGLNGSAHVALEADGGILVGGEFTMVNGVSRLHMARLPNGPAVNQLTGTSRQRVLWTRGGTAPEVEYVSFELSTNGGTNWTSLGSGVRTAGGWERTGLNLPASGHFRARGRTRGGYAAGSSGLVETVVPFVFQPEIALHDGPGVTDPEVLSGQSDAINFGVARQPVPVARQFTVTNTGNAPLNVSALAAPPGYSVLNLPALPAVVDAGVTITFSVRLDANTPGAYAGNVTITSNDSDEPVFAIPVSGTVITPEITVHDGDVNAPELQDGQAPAVNFGRHVQGTPGSRTFTVANTGTAELLISGVTVPAGFTLLNPPALPLTVGVGQSVSLQISLTTLSVGVHSGGVVIASDDIDEASFDFPITGEVFIPDPVAAMPASLTTLNRQSGLREQTIHIANDTTATVPAYNLIIRGLPEGVEVNNASERREDGSWVVYVRQAMNPRSTQDILLEYFSANRGPVEIAPQVSTEVVLNPPDLSVPGAPGFVIDRVVQLEGGAVLIEFPTTSGRQYQVQYSHDGANWQASLPGIRAAANRTQWLDRGLPRTDSHPSAHASRFYRVAELAP
jgi:uncharacterized delta-60 repeat protein